MPDHPRELVVLHYHFRAGGVRRVIELLIPELARQFEIITLLGGEKPDAEWERAVLRAAPCAKFVVCQSLHYLESGTISSAGQRKKIRRTLARHIKPDSLVWAHNLALGRNILLSDEMATHSGATGVRLLSHHHDFWCDRRWMRWPGMQACGFRSLSSVANAVFAAGARVVHIGINSCDTRLLSRHLPGTVWLPNPSDTARQSSPAGVRHAREWLSGQLGDDAPVWLYPARFLRRKNFAEAVLLARWMNPEGWLVSTGGVSSPAEEACARKLLGAAMHGNWKARFGLLSHAAPSSPPISDLIAAAHSLVMTSVQEGFGFPYLEGASQRLVARCIPQIQPDLDTLGVRLPGLYAEVWIPPEIFNHRAERRRQEAIFRRWRAALPASVRQFAEPPRFLEAPDEPVAFSRLTLEAQIEVISIPPAQSWGFCMRNNPALAGLSACPKSHHPEGDFLSPEKCVSRLLAINFQETPPNPRQTRAAQLGIIGERLENRFFFPILL